MKLNRKQRIAGFSMLEIMVIVIIIGILSIIAIPMARKASATAYQKNCLNNLRIIDQAKQQAALELRLQSNAVISLDQLTPFFQRAVPACAAGGTEATFETSYEINDVSVPASCKIDPVNHRLPTNPE